MEEIQKLLRSEEWVFGKTPKFSLKLVRKIFWGKLNFWGELGRWRRIFPRFPINFASFGGSRVRIMVGGSSNPLHRGKLRTKCAGINEMSTQMKIPFFLIENFIKKIPFLIKIRKTSFLIIAFSWTHTWKTLGAPSVWRMGGSTRAPTRSSRSAASSTVHFWSPNTRNSSKADWSSSLQCFTFCSFNFVLLLFSGQFRRYIEASPIYLAIITYFITH